MADVIIIPGRGVYPDGSLYIDPISRINKAVELYEHGKANKIIMSGGFSFHFENYSAVNESKSMKRYAISLGVNPNNILTEDRSTHTLANAYFCKKMYSEPKNFKSIIVVASSDHMPRVRYVFSKLFGVNYDINTLKVSKA